jgi:hypothetical protein
VLGSGTPEVRQLVSGATDGPLGLATERDPASVVLPPKKAEEGLEVPLPLTALALLIVLTASAVVLGRAQPVEVAALAVVWGAAGVLLTLRWRRR